MTPRPAHSCYSPSLSVMLTELTQSCTLSHCSGLWSSAPPGRMASLLNHNPLILSELVSQKAQPKLCTLPTRSSGMSANLSFFLLHQYCDIGCPGLESSLDSCLGWFIAALRYSTIDLLTHMFGFIPRWPIAGVAYAWPVYFIL